MPSRFHPIEDGLWNDEKFDPKGELPEAPFEERAFFAFLSANTRQRPAGIYRATDGQLAEDTRIPINQVRAYLADLDVRRLIVRDGAWIFVVGYFKRLPKHPHLLRAAESNVRECSSERILRAFFDRYPMVNRWLRDHPAMVGKRSADGVSTFIDQLGVSLFVDTSPRLSGEELERRGTGEELERNGEEEECSDQTAGAIGRHPLPATGEESHESDRAGTEKGLDPTLKAILDECPHLSLVSTPASSGFWDQVLGACEPYPTADGAWLGAKLRQWNQWFESNPSRRSRDRKRLESRLMGWLMRDLEGLARRPW